MARPGEDDLLSEYLALSPHPAAILHSTSPGNPPDYIFSNKAFPVRIKDAIRSLVQRRGRTAGSEDVSDGGLVKEIVADWSWEIRSLQDDTVFVVEGRTVTPSASQSKPHPLLLPTPDNPSPYPSQRGPDLTAVSQAALEHNALFLSLPWRDSSLGAIETWSPQLRGAVQTMMATPFPVLISYGPEYVQLYNEPYSKVIGLKHPTILGQTYPVAWHEIWEQLLKREIEASYQGNVLNVDCQEMFLLRGEKLEECYFSYSLIPIRDTNNETCGLYIPNFDNTVRIITERRIRSLHSISQRITRSLTQEAVVRDALESMQSSNARDIHFALFYVSESVEEQDSAVAPDGLETYSNGGRSGLYTLGSSESGEAGSRLKFRLAGSYGINETRNEVVPLEIYSGPDDEGSEAAAPDTLIWYIRQARESASTIRIPDLSALPSLADMLNGNPFDDPPGAAVVLPIRSSAEDRLHGVMVIGLNTRLPWDEDYSNYIQLVKGLLATGLATIKLHAEDLSRARYLAALNRQKSDELQSLLKHKTKELKTSELKFRSAFAACPAGIWIGSPEGTIWDMNQAYFQMSGHPTDVPLDEWYHRVHPDDKAMVLDMFTQCKKRMVDCEFRFLPTEEEIAAGMTEKWVEASGGPVLDETGTIVMLCGALLDITLRRNHLMNQTRRADEALELKRLQDHFIDMLSHELRNPLSAICLSSDGVVERLELLETRCSSDLVAELRDIVKDAGVINLCTVHMRRLVDDVLALSKLDNNMLLVTPTVCQPEAFSQQVLEMVQTEMIANDISCSFEIKPGYRDLNVDWVQVDHSRVNQILINLLTNAIKFTRTSDQRCITLSLDATTMIPRLVGDHLSSIPDEARNGDRPGTYLIFEVVDTGVGMDEAEIQRLFQRFAQGSDRTHLTFGGSGLGLFICRRITHLLGGEISVKSLQGKGSTFSFFIPVQSCPPPTPSERRSSVQSLVSAIAEMNANTSVLTVPLPDSRLSACNSETNLRRDSSEGVFVLLAEDNEISQKLLKKQLTRAGCKVVAVDDGVEAVEFVTSNAAGSGPLIDVILMDIEMPRKGGIAATQDIRALEASEHLPGRIPIIAVSANARSGQIEAMLGAGMDAAVSKPFKMPQLLRQIENLTGKRPNGAT